MDPFIVEDTEAQRDLPTQSWQQTRPVLLARARVLLPGKLSKGRHPHSASCCTALHCGVEAQATLSEEKSATLPASTPKRIITHQSHPKGYPPSFHHPKPRGGTNMSWFSQDFPGLGIESPTFWEFPQPRGRVGQLVTLEYLLLPVQTLRLCCPP